jgi:type VI secretion system protein ImpH
MAGPAGHADTDLRGLREDLLRRTDRYEFGQAVRLLRLLTVREKGGNAAGEDFWKGIRIRPALSLAFPPRDLSSLRWEDPEGVPQLEVNFFGLYGVSSPLPTFYTEDLIGEQNEDGSTARDFLDILHGVLYPLLYDSWEKVRLSLRAYEKGEEEVENLFHVFTGLSQPVFREADPLCPTALRYAGLLTLHPRSARGLEEILSDVLEGVRVEIEQCVERTVPLPEEQRLFLGARLPLGEETVLGDRIRNRSNQIRIRIGPVDNRGFETLLPARENFRKVAFWQEFYLTDPVSAEVSLLLEDREPEPVRLGATRRCRLGLDAWLESGSFSSRKSVVFPLTSVLTSSTEGAP